MPRRLPVTDWNFDTDADVPTVSYPPTLSPNSHICRHSMFKPDALLAERRASSSSRRSNNAGRTRPGKFRASSHSSVPQPRHRQDATSSPTIAHTMDATSPTTRHAYPAKLGRGDARYGKNCDCSKGSRYMLPWPTLLTLYAWNVASVSCAKASVIPTPAPRTSSHAISVIMSSSAETGAYTYIPRWRRQATHAGGSTDGRVSNGNDDVGSLNSALASIASFASSEVLSLVSVSESSSGTNLASSPVNTDTSTLSESTSSSDSTSSTTSQLTSFSSTSTTTTRITDTTSTTSSSTTSSTTLSTTATNGSSSTTSSSSTSTSSVTSQTSGTSSSSTSTSTATTSGTSARTSTTSSSTRTTSTSSLFTSSSTLTSTSLPSYSSNHASDTVSRSHRDSTTRHHSSSVAITSSRPVLGPTTTPTTRTATRTTTLFTTVVSQTIYTTDGMTHTSTYTTVVPTGTLIPNQATVDGNVFAHDKGALAGLIVGVIAFVGLTAAWGFFAYRRHHVRRMQAEAAAAALGRSHGGPRALVLDEDDEDGGAAATRFIGVGPVSHPPSGGIVYDRIRGGNTLESPTGEDGSMSPVGDARSQDDAGGGMAALAPVPIVGTGEDASLMHPANRSAADVTLPVDPEADVEISVLPFPPPRQPMSPSRSLTSRPSSGPGPEPAEWLGGRAVSYNSLRNRASADRYRTEVPLPASPTSRTSRSSVYSDEVVSSPSHTAQPDPHMVATAATMATTGALGPAYTSKNASMSSHGHAGYMSSSSIHGHTGAGGGSSSGEHGSSSGHRTGTGSSSGHMLSSGYTSTHSHAPLLSGPPAPSSLLPTQTHRPDAPPSAYRDIGDEESGRELGGQRRMSLLGRSLRGLRIRSSARNSISSAAGMSAPPTTTVSPAASTTLLSKPRHSLHDPLAIRPSSIVRPQSPVLGTLPQTTFPPVPPIHEPAGYGADSGPTLGPYATTASGVPIWPGLSALHGQPAMPSPALTEGSSVNVPEGLLDPRLALRLGAQGMQSQGAISFRDDMDYSRPIGGWVNNRQYSRTTIQTMSTRDSPRRPSLESRDTHATGMETIHAHTEAPGLSEDELPPQP